MIFNNPRNLLETTALVDRFMRYVAITTTSDPTADTCPSTSGQLRLGGLLRDELISMGLENARLDPNGYVYAHLEGTHSVRIGLLAHLDTSPQFCGENVQAVQHPAYNGLPIHLAGNVVISPDQSPLLSRCIGHTIVTSDGTTLLGADDKAGIAIVMTALEVLLRHPELPRPALRIGFIPDEEIGRGHMKFPFNAFDADLAFTLDGSAPGELNLETFEAWAMTIRFRGVSTHPGTARGKMVNALRHLSHFVGKLPEAISPECTSGREGFIHPTEISGDASAARCELIIRDFDTDKAIALCDLVESLALSCKEREPRLEIEVQRSFTYPNMGRFLLQRPDLPARMKKAVRDAGLIPEIVPIRGGTDGSNLSAKGLLCPNIYTGGMNFHGPTEWISTTHMASALCTTLNLILSFTEQ